MARKLDEGIIQRAVDFTRDWPQYLTGEDAERYAELSAIDGEDARAAAIAVLQMPALRIAAAEAFAAVPENRQHPGEMVAAAERIAQSYIRDARGQLQREMARDGLTRADLRECPPIHEWTGKKKPRDAPKTVAELQYSERFTDARLYEAIATRVVHCLLALTADEAGNAEHLQRVETLLNEAVRQKWGADAPDGVTVKPLKRRPSPEYKTTLVDQCTRAVLDADSTAHRTLFERLEAVIAPIPKRNVQTRIKLLDLSDVQEGIFELSRSAAAMFRTLVTLCDDVVTTGGDEMAWPIDDVVRCYKNGGSALGAGRTAVTQAERDHAWACIRELAAIGLRIDWQDEARIRKAQYAPFEGPIIRYKREPRLVNDKTTDCLVIDLLPPLLSYARAVGRIDRQPARLTVVKLGRRSDRTIALQNYVENRIIAAKRRKLPYVDIKLASAWTHYRDESGPPDEWQEWVDISRDAKQKLRSVLRQITDGFSKTGFITGATFPRRAHGEMDRLRVSLAGAADDAITAKTGRSGKPVKRAVKHK